MIFISIIYFYSKKKQNIFPIPKVAAHVGMLKAIQEAGIPIDIVGGVSIGAFIGTLWCVDSNIATVAQKAREWSKV